jgi:tetratricopeptide (TPR) repeat protein
MPKGIYAGCARRLTARACPANFARQPDRNIIAEWQRLQAKHVTGRDVFIAGVAAFDTALAQRQLQTAQNIAQDLLRQTRSAYRADLPETVRDLNVSLDKVGDVAKAQGDWDAAEAAYRESPDLQRGQRQRLGDQPEIVRDLSISLDRIGDVAQAQGDWDAAAAAYRESLDLMREQRQRLGDTPETVRDLSISLSNVAGVSMAREDWDAAAAAYRESLALWQRLALAFPHNPEHRDEIQRIEQQLTSIQNRRSLSTPSAE